MIELNNSMNVSMTISPACCFKLRLIAIYCLFVLILSVPSNLILVIALCSKKHLNKPYHILLFSFSLICLIGSASELPVVIIANWECRWVFEDIGCRLSAFIMCFTGVSSAYLVTFMVFERYQALKDLKKPHNNNLITPRHAYKMVLVSIAMSLFWSISPLVGWSQYALEGARTSCSVNWNVRSFNTTSYIVAIMTFVFLIPFTVIIISSILIVHIIKKLPHMADDSAIKCRKRIHFERNLTISSIFVISSFLVTWFPYAVVSAYSAIFDSSWLNPLLTTLPAIFAKSSCVWSPLMYIVANKDIIKLIQMKFSHIRK